MVSEAEKYKAEDDANRNRIEAKNGLENYCYSLKGSISSDEVKDKIPEDKKKELEDAIEEAISWLDANQSAEKEEYEEKQKELEGLCNPIMQKLYAGAGGPEGGMPGGMPGGAPGGAPDAAGDDAGPKIEEVD